MLTIAQREAWVRNLKAGDAVGVFEFMGRIFVHAQKVAKVTKSGRVTLENGVRYHPDGRIYGSKNGRSIAPKPEGK